MSTKIEYADETLNPFAGCSPCSPGCENCYAAEIASGRFLKDHPLYKGLAVNGKWTGEVRTCFDIDRPDILDLPLRWKKPKVIFWGNMGDMFHPRMEIGFLTHLFDVIKQCPQYKHLILTKRPKQALKMMWGKQGSGWSYFGKGDFHKSIHFGATICNQDEADSLIPILLRIPAAHRWLSVEPMLGPVDLWKADYPTPDGCGKQGAVTSWPGGVDRVVIGCESGPKRRPCKIEDMINLVNQCKAAGVPVFVKQVNINGRVSHDMSEWPEEVRIRQGWKEQEK